MPPTKDKIQEFPLTFEGGLVTEVEDSTLEVGQAASLVNWVPTAQGGLRARNKWSNISVQGLDALNGEYKVRGWGTAPVGGGSGVATPSIVQSDFEDIDNAGFAGTLSATLTGVTAGNILVGVALVGDPGGPTSVSAGYTQRVAAEDTGISVYIYTKTSAGGSETFEATEVGDMASVRLYELANVTTEAPTDSDIREATLGLESLSVTSVTNAGIGIGAFVAGGSDVEWDDLPDDGFWTIDRNFGNGTVVYRFTHTSGVYSSAPDAASIDPDATVSFFAGAVAIWDATTAASTPAEFNIFMAVATDTGYSIYSIARDQIQTGTWELVDSVTCDDTSAFVSMAVGAGTLVWSASTMDVPRAVVLSSLSASDVTNLSDKSGRAVAYHKDRMFVAGSTTTPSRVYFSDIGDPDAFTTATDFLDIGGDDGEAIEDILSVEGLLLVCKTNRLYLVSGSGIESFFVNELAGGSAATGRAAVRTPYGTIVVGPNDIWVVQGGGVDPMSRPLGADFQITGLVSTAYAQDIALIADSSTGNVWRVNLVTGSWSLENVNDDEHIVGHLFSLQGRLYYGVIDGSTTVGGTRRLSSARDYDFVGGTSFEASTGKLALLGPSVTYTPRHLFLQVRNNDPALPNALHVTVTTDLGEETKGEMIAEEVKRYRFDLGAHRNASWIQVALSADSSAIAGALDVERTVLSTYVDAIR